MTEADRKPFGLVMAALAAAYREECDEAVLEGYWLSLADLELPAIRGAVAIACRTSKFMPKAAELRATVIEAMTAAQRELDRARRACEYKRSIVYGIEQDALKKGWTNEQLVAEIRRVGENVGLDLPGPTIELPVPAAKEG